MTEQDVANVRQTMEDLVRTVIIPGLERKFKELSAAVNDRKKGLKRFKHWIYRSSSIDTDLGASPSPAASPESGRASTDGAWGAAYQARFKFGTPEMQQRLVADLAFILQDYDVRGEGWPGWGRPDGRTGGLVCMWGRMWVRR